ncbi:hypothetical protein CK203_058657 [Vitis vinifera]|uniref:Uncharacterized protein n=1 Tax=Vitis vinifera TaxID=29760 RepID=A0A438FTG5_VITVI|nr:hypothetical protein CK203_058657 [Vitis vinifera]
MEEATQSGCYSTSLPEIAMSNFRALGPGALVGPEHPEIPHPEHPEEPQPVQIPADLRAPTPAVPSIEPIPEVAPSAPPTIPRTPPVIPSISEPLLSSEPRITIHFRVQRPMSHFAGIDHFSEHPDSADDSSSCSSGADYRHLDSAYYHPYADSAPSGYSISS